MKTIVVLFCIYVGCYLALLRPWIIVEEMHLRIVLKGYREAGYAVGGKFSHAIFSPAHWLDRQVRPKYWADASEKLQLKKQKPATN